MGSLPLWVSPMRSFSYEVAKKRVGSDQVAAAVFAAIVVAEAPLTAVAAAGLNGTLRSVPSSEPYTILPLTQAMPRTLRQSMPVVVSAKLVAPTIEPSLVR